MKKQLNKTQYIKISLFAFLTSLGANTMAQNNDFEKELSKSGIKLNNGYTNQSQKETNDDPSVVISAGSVPKNTTLNNDESGQSQSFGINLPQQNLVNSASPNDSKNKLTEITQENKKKLAELNGNSVPEQNQIISGSLSNNQNYNSKKEQSSSGNIKSPLRKSSGPNVQHVGIEAFNKNSLNEMTKKGQLNTQEEYLKFRIQAEQHKNKPVKIK